MNRLRDRRRSPPLHRLVLLALCTGLLLVPFTAGGKPSRTTPPPLIHQIQGSPDSARVNAWLIEGARSLILVDTLFTTTDFTLLKKRIASVGKPLSAIIVTHPHPDHYNNLADLLKEYPAASSLAAQSVIEAIRRDDPAQRRFWSSFYPSTYPREFVPPATPLPSSGTVTYDDITITVATLEKGEAPAQTLLFIPDAGALITGDLVMNRVHPSFSGADSAGWLSALDQIDRLFPEAHRILPGHGDEGGRDIIVTQRNYLTRLRGEIRKRIDPSNEETPLPHEGFSEVSSIMLKEFPYDAGYNLGRAIQAVVAEIVATLPRQTVEPFMY